MPGTVSNHSRASLRRPGHATLCAQRGIRLDRLEVHSEGDIDLRGFLGLDAGVRPGCRELRYRAHLAGDASAEELREIHETVVATSPTRSNLSHPVRVRAELQVGETS